MGGSSPNSDFLGGKFCVFSCLLCCFHVLKCLKKKMVNGVGGWGLTNPSFFPDVLIFFKCDAYTAPQSQKAVSAYF